MPLTATALKLIDEALTAADDGDNEHVFAGTHDASVAQRSKRAMAALKNRMRSASAPDGTIPVTGRDADGSCEHSTLRGREAADHCVVGEVGAVSGIYMRHDYRDEKLTALETLERRIDSILMAKDGSRVVPFAR